MSVLIKLVLHFYLIIIIVSESEKDQTININHFENASSSQKTILETTTTSLNFEHDLIPSNSSKSDPYDCDNNICIIKCCPEGQLLVEATLECNNISLHNAKDWKPKNLKNYIIVIKSILDFITIYAAKKNFVCPLHRPDDFLLDQDGTVYHNSLEQSFSQEFYCIDNKLKDEKIEETAVICHEPYDSNTPYERVTNDLHTAAIAISAILLFIMILMYIFTPHELNLQKKCTLASCSNLFLAFLILLINKSSLVKILRYEGCLTLGILTQYFFLSFYFWLNINCFEIFRIIRGTFNLILIGDLSQSIHRYFIYCVYCNGCPLLICALTIAMQVISIESFPSSIQQYIIKPNINIGRCFLQEGESSIVYFSVFEISLHAANAFFMGYTTYLLYKEKLIVIFCKRGTTTVQIRTHAACNHLDAFKQQLRIYILYIFIWILNLMTLIRKRLKMWRIVDIIVALQGVFVFLFIIHTSKTILVDPLLEKISNSAREFSSRFMESKTLSSASTGTSAISLDSHDQKKQSTGTSTTSLISLGKSNLSRAN